MYGTAPYEFWCVCVCEYVGASRCGDRNIEILNLLGILLESGGHDLIANVECRHKYIQT